MAFYRIKSNYLYQSMKSVFKNAVALVLVAIAAIACKEPEPPKNANITLTIEGKAVTELKTHIDGLIRFAFDAATADGAVVIGGVKDRNSVSISSENPEMLKVTKLSVKALKAGKTNLFLAADGATKKIAVEIAEKPETDGIWLLKHGKEGSMIEEIYIPKKPFTTMKSWLTELRLAMGKNYNFSKRENGHYFFTRKKDTGAVLFSGIFYEHGGLPLIRCLLLYPVSNLKPGDSAEAFFNRNKVTILNMCTFTEGHKEEGKNFQGVTRDASLSAQLNYDIMEDAGEKYIRLTLSILPLSWPPVAK